MVPALVAPHPPPPEGLVDEGRAAVVTLKVEVALTVPPILTVMPTFWPRANGTLKPKTDSQRKKGAANLFGCMAP